MNGQLNMKNSPTPNVSSETHHQPGTFAVVWHSLTESATTLSEPQRRRSYVLTIIILTLLFSAVLFLVSLLSINIDIDLRGVYTILIGILLFIFAIAFGLNRAGHYTAAAGLIITCMILAPWTSILLNFAALGSDIFRLLYITASVVLCSFLLSTRVTIILAATQLAALWLLSLYGPVLSGTQWSSLLGFFGFISILCIISNFINRRDLDQIDRQTNQLIESETLLRELSIRDPLTGLFNRRYLEETLDRELSRVARNKLPLGIIMLDIDHFKQFNDTHGHEAGDVLLRQVGETLKESIRASDIACRYGGEEFTLILPEASQEITHQRAEQVHEDVKHLQINYDDKILDGVTMSLGVAAFPINGSTPTAILRAADDALYLAKREGRDRVIVAKKSSNHNLP